MNYNTLNQEKKGEEDKSIEGYFIRQEKLDELRDEFPQVFTVFRDGLTKRYF